MKNCLNLIKKMETQKKLTRTTGSEAMVFGICGGLAKYFGVDKTLIRVAWAVITFLGVGSPILIYLLMAFIIPKEA
jgi:phage shock protein PspC (stress-responsive transcriptional regulator)